MASPQRTDSTLPPYEAGSRTTTSEPLDQATMRQVLERLTNDPRLAELNFDIPGLGRTTFDVNCLPISVVQALVAVGLAMNAEVDRNDE